LTEERQDHGRLGAGSTIRKGDPSSAREIEKHAIINWTVEEGNQREREDSSEARPSSFKKNVVRQVIALERKGERPLRWTLKRALCKPGLREQSRKERKNTENHTEKGEVG